MTALSRNSRLALGVVGTAGVIIGAPLAALLAIETSEVFGVGLFTPLPLVVAAGFLLIGLTGSGLIVTVVFETIEECRTQTARERRARQRRWRR